MFSFALEIALQVHMLIALQVVPTIHIYRTVARQEFFLLATSSPPLSYALASSFD